MKFTLVVLAALLGVALAQQPGEQICLPSRFQWQRSQQWDQDLKNGTGGFDLSEEFFDHDANNYRTKYRIFENNVEKWFDFLILGNAGKLYTIGGTQGSGSITCNVTTIPSPNPTPCLLSNATIAASYFIAGDVYVQVWSESYLNPSNKQPIYQYVSLTAEDNIPIASREFNNGGMSFELYYNYDLNIEPDAFEVPSICATAQAVPFNRAQVRRAFSRVLKF